MTMTVSHLIRQLRYVKNQNAEIIFDYNGYHLDPFYWSTRETPTRRSSNDKNDQYFCIELVRK